MTFLQMHDCSEELLHHQHKPKLGEKSTPSCRASLAGVLHPVWTTHSCGQQDSLSGDVVHPGIFMLSLSLYFCLLNRSVQVGAGREGVKSSFKQGSALGNSQPG